jgi:galactose-1-phosphate uridylyltransferase
MTQRLDRETLAQILQAPDIEGVAFSRLLELFREEEALAPLLPDPLFRVDPRSGDCVIFNPARARRPHDAVAQQAESARDEACVVCQGLTTGVLDVAGLSRGFTFVNKNLYPIVFPFPPEEMQARSTPIAGVQPAGGTLSGLHFLQWTSSFHDKDWHNMPLEDCEVVLRRLAALERRLLQGAEELLPAAAGQAFVLIAKNYGRLVGGSLHHGHQQIMLTHVMPRRMRDNWQFQRERGLSFSSYMLRTNPDALLVQDYGPAVLLVPYFMRRPYDMMLLVRDATKAYLHELNDQELVAVARGWHDGLQTIHRIMPAIGRELAYRVMVHNGPGAGLYFEFLPYTQETGALENLGLVVCQADPHEAADRLRRYLLE